MVYLLFYENVVPGHVSDTSYIMKWCETFNVTPILIDLYKKYPKQTDYPPFKFRTLEDAIKYKKFKNCEWFFTDHRANKYWDEVQLPKDNVIYCVGDDTTGYQDNNLNGKLIKVRSVNKKMENREWYASMVATMLLFEVFK